MAAMQFPPMAVPLVACTNKVSYCVKFEPRQCKHVCIKRGAIVLGLFDGCWCVSDSRAVIGKLSEPVQ